MQLSEMMQTLNIIKRENETNKEKFREFDEEMLRDLIKRGSEPPLESLYLTYERPAPFSDKNLKKLGHSQLAKRV
jgi:hypothetical protein